MPPINFFTTTGSLKTDQVWHFYNGTAFVDMVPSTASLIPTIYGGGWQSPGWKVESGRYTIFYTVDPSFNSGTIAQLKGRWSDDAGQTWIGHNASDSRIANLGINDSNDRFWPPAVQYDPTRDQVDMAIFGFDNSSAILRRLWQAARTDPDSITSTGTGLGLSGGGDLENGYYALSGSPSPDALNEINIVGVGTRHRGGSDRSAYAGVGAPGIIELVERTTNTSFFQLSQSIDIGQTDENIGGIFVVAPEEQGDSSRDHTIVIYADRTTDGTMRWVHMSYTTAGDGIIEASGTLFNGLQYDGYFDSGSDAERLGGTATFFYDTSASLVHCWMKEVNLGASNDNSVFYQQLNVTMSLFDGGGTITESGYFRIDNFGAEGLRYSINGGAQSGSIYCLVHDGTGGVIKVYRKTDPTLNANWVEETFVSQSLLATNGIAWLMNDFNPTTQSFDDTPTPSTTPIAEPTFSNPDTLAAGGRGGSFRRGDNEPLGLEFPVELTDISEDPKVLGIGIDYQKWLFDLSNNFVSQSFGKKTADFVTNLYVENIKRGRDIVFGNRPIRFNRVPLQHAMESIFIGSNNISHICPTCQSDVLSNGILGFWAGALFSGENFPQGAERVIQNYVIPGDAIELQFTELSMPGLLAVDMINSFKKNLDSMSGLLSVEVTNGHLQTFTWKGFR